MKTIFVLAFLTLLFSCSSGKNDKSKQAIDTMNGIDNRGIQDTQVSPQPNGYAPPNTKIDTSQRLKDSINAAHKQ